MQLMAHSKHHLQVSYDLAHVVKVMDVSLGNPPSKWEYPSPQQFYNALMRKGWNTPEEHAEAMVLLHNRLNEDAWAEILRWEMRFGGG
jgi:cytochrome c heme-lyase